MTSSSVAQLPMMSMMSMMSIGLDAARDQLGHSDGSVTFQYYVGKRILGPDLRHLLDRFFAPLE